MVRLALESVTRQFDTIPPVRALDGVSASFSQGEYVAIEGESGGGKSTLLGVLGVLDHPSTGRYMLDGIDVSSMTDRQSAAVRSDTMGYIFQSFHLLDRRTVIDNVELPLHYRGVESADRRQRATEALTAVGLADFADARPGLLSGGQRQRVAIARAMAAATPVLLADEPTGNLDSANGKGVLELFEHVRRRGTTIIVVTHSGAVAERAERRLRVVDGRIVEDSGAVPSAPSRVAPPRPGRASRVVVRDVLRDAWRNVASRSGRTLALVAAIAVPLALAVTTLGLSSSAAVQVSVDFDTIAAREVSLQAPGDDFSATLDRPLAEAARSLAALNGVSAAAVLEDAGTHILRVGAAREPVETSVLSGAGDVVDAMRLAVTWAPGSTTIADRQILLGTHLADNLGLGPVDLAPTMNLDGETYVVVGIIEGSPRRTDLLGKALVAEPAQADRPTGTVTGYLVTRPGAAPQVAGEAPLALDPYEPGRFDVAQPPPPSATRERVEASVSMSLTVLTVVALVGAIGSIILATVNSVAERSAEIGLRRALGGRRLHVSVMLVMESLVIGVLGALTGVVLGMGVILTITVLRQWTPVFDVRLALLALGAGIAIACFGAIAGALRAGFVLPNAALRS